MRKVWLGLVVGAGLSTGCVTALEDGAKGEVALPGGGGDVEKPLPWGPSDSPTIFTSDLKYVITELPAQGEAAAIPWAGSYWPTYHDSINYKWDGPQSEPATTKYGRAFNVTGVEDAVSRLRGVAGQSSRKTCKLDSECDPQIGETCGKRVGAEEGKCIPTWWGICHAWAPGAILSAEPQKPVTVNGVTFKVNDIKALLTLIHERVETRFVSLRCNKDEARKEIEYDDAGRPKQGECIDTNPATWHLLATNYLGVKRQSFVMDRTYDDEVWNQPLRGYRVTSQTEVTAEQAIALVGIPPEGAVVDTQTLQVAQGEWKHLQAYDVTAGTQLKVAMTGTGDADLYVRFGEQPTDRLFDCRPYGGSSDENCELTVPATATKAFVSAQGYAAASVTLKVSRGGTPVRDYRYNPNARRFFEVRMDVQYIGESATETDGPLGSQIDRYTHVDRLHYLLETDADGKLIGGEWLDDSKRMHPDFLWLPTRVNGTTVAENKIKVADIMGLLEQSIATEGGGTQGTPRSFTETGTVAKGAWTHFGPYNAQAGTPFAVEMTGTGDADLYVRKGTAPTVSQYDCRPYKNGSAESCSGAPPGQFYVSVNGYAASSTFSLTIRFVEPTGDVTPPPPPPPVTTHLNVSGNVALNAFSHHSLPVKAGKLVVIKTAAPQDVDLYIQMDRQASRNDYVQQAISSSGNEEIRFTPQVDGTLHIGVYGYQASAFTLTTQDN